MDRKVRVVRADGERPAVRCGAAGPWDEVERDALTRREQCAHRACQPEHKGRQLELHRVEHVHIPVVREREVVRSERGRQRDGGGVQELARCRVPLAYRGRQRVARERRRPRPAHHPPPLPILTRMGCKANAGADCAVEVTAKAGRDGEAAIRQVAGPVKSLDAEVVERRRVDPARQRRLPQREALAAPRHRYVRVCWVLQRDAANVGEEAASGLRAKRVAVEDLVGLHLRIEVWRAHELRHEVRAAGAAVEREAAEKSVAVEDVVVAPPAALEVAGAVAKDRSPEAARDPPRDLCNLIFSWDVPC
mmetsp:Transcript_6606/g.15315  ORF Transcript_6606/g.15315 Transcript_6606/m.15315 type:complete len:306 (-) Transcript_6606:198-1115(-)